jgi:hypothetical protein
MSVFYYVWRHALRKTVRNKLMTFQANDQWQNIRYLLEKRYHMHEHQRKAKKNRSYISGNKVVRSIITGEVIEEKLDDNEMVHSGSVLVLYRKPMQHESVPFIPAKFLNKKSEETKTKETKTNPSPDKMEEEKMLEVLAAAQATVQRPAKQKGYHPSLDDEEFYPMTKLTTETNPQIVEITRQGPRRAAIGIPKTQLRLAETDEEKENAMIDKDGKLVVRKEVHKFGRK